MVYLYELYEQYCWQGDDCPGEGEGKGEGEEGGFEEGEVEDDEEGDQLNLSSNQLDLNWSFDKATKKRGALFSEPIEKMTIAMKELFNIFGWEQHLNWLIVL